MGKNRTPSATGADKQTEPQGAEGGEGLGARLVRARLEWGLKQQPPRPVSQAEVGRALGVTGVAVGSWESGKNEPTLDTLRRIAQLYGVRPAWLAFAEPPMVAPPPVVLGVPQFPPLGSLPRDDMHERTALTSAEAERLKLQQEQTAARARRRVAGEGSRRRSG